MGLASRIASHAIGWAAIEGNIVRPQEKRAP